MIRITRIFLSQYHRKGNARLSVSSVGSVDFFDHGFYGLHGCFSRGMRILSHAEDAECAEVHLLCLCSSGVLALLSTKDTNGHGSFVSG